MAISKGNPSECLQDILNKVSELDILIFYLGINKLPCLINSPFREDKHPSFSIFTPDYSKVYYKDFATNERGNIYGLLSQIWGVNYKDVLYTISKDLPKISNKENITKYKKVIKQSKYNKATSNLECKIREWREYDLEYWKSYGISLKWLKYAEVYPISNIIITKDGERYVISADKYSYVFIENKEDKITMKIYQPFNTKGFKWTNKHDASVIGLWTKVPEYGDKICICSSVKDALCLWSNIKIPSICLQGEGYNISNTAIKELYRRYKEVYICLDNDEAGLEDAEKLSQTTGFTNIILPKFEGGKDISDLFKIVGKDKFTSIVSPLFYK